MSANTAFSSAHRIYVKSLYKRYLTNSLDWCINRPLWREQAMLIRAEFEKNRYCREFEPPSVRTILMMHICSDVTDPRALAEILERAERDLVARRHPDPYIGQFNIPSPRYTPLIPTHSSFLPWWYKMVCIHLPDS